MSKNPRQKRRRFPVRMWLLVFKTVIGIGQAAALISKLISIMSQR